MEKVLFRVDGSAQIGLGHLMRCLALADSFRERKVESLFVMQEDEGCGEEIVRQRNHALVRLKKTPEEEELRELNAIIAQESPLAVFLDGYRFGYSYQHKVAKGSAFLVAMCWLHDFCSPADIIINQNLWAAPGLYAGKVSPRTLLLLGTEFVLLPADFRREKPKVKEKCERIVISFGGGRLSALGREVYRCLKGLPYHFTLLVGPYAKLESDYSDHNLSVVSGSYNLYPYLREADLAVSACGSTAWELCALGVPFLTYIVSDNQERNALLLQEHEAAINMGWLGPKQEFDSDRLRKKITALAGSYEERFMMSLRGKELVDGYGAARVSKIVCDLYHRQKSR